MKAFKNYFIYPKFQFPLIFINFGLFIILGLLLYFQESRNYESLLIMGEKLGLTSDHVYFNFIKVQRSAFFMKSSLVLFFSFLLSSVGIIFYSRRLAGPIVRMQGHFKNYLKTKDYQELKFRRNDFFQEIPGLVNQIIREKNE